jgi:hypothetical protein
MEMGIPRAKRGSSWAASSTRSVTGPSSASMPARPRNRPAKYGILAWARGNRRQMGSTIRLAEPEGSPAECRRRAYPALVQARWMQGPPCQASTPVLCSGTPGQSCSRTRPRTPRQMPRPATARPGTSTTTAPNLRRRRSLRTLLRVCGHLEGGRSGAGGACEAAETRSFAIIGASWDQSRQKLPLRGMPISQTVRPHLTSARYPPPVGKVDHSITFQRCAIRTLA